MRRLIERHLFSLVFGAIGTIFFLVGLILVGGGIMSRRDVGRLEQLPVLNTAAQLDKAAVETEIVLEGKVSERNPLQFSPFVAYIRQTYQGERCRDDPNDDDNSRDCEAVWAEDERATPPLWLDLPEGRARLANTDYQLLGPPFTQRSGSLLVAYATHSYQGFRINDPIFVQGWVVDDAGGRGVRARLIYGGSRGAYLAYARTSAGILTWIGAIFGAVGGAFLIILVVKTLFGK